MTLSRLNDKTFTIINRIPKSADNAQITEWTKNTLKQCGKQGGISGGKTDQAMTFKASSWTALLFDWESYKAPDWNTGYYALKDKSGYYTAAPGDLIIFADIPDSVPVNEQEFQKLITKYKNMGGVITSAQAYISFKANGEPWRTNHIEVIKE